MLGRWKQYWASIKPPSNASRFLGISPTQKHVVIGFIQRWSSDASTLYDLHCVRLYILGPRRHDTLDQCWFNAGPRWVGIKSALVQCLVLLERHITLVLVRFSDKAEEGGSVILAFFPFDPFLFWRHFVPFWSGPTGVGMAETNHLPLGWGALNLAVSSRMRY